MIKKLFVPILKICKSKFIKIEDPRFANREAEQIGTKLVSSWDRMPNVGKQRANLENEMAKERHEQIMAKREEEGRPKYVSEVTTPREEQVLGPSDSALKEEEK